MKTEVEDKLDKISNIWNHFIWEYKTCNLKIKFTEDVKTNYFGDILGYFQDTFEIVFQDRKLKTYSDRFSYEISLLQAIYIHQDFIEELLEIFKCDIDKGILKNDINYSINRELRNELVGHPFRKKSGKLISSTTFGYHPKKGCLTYLRYHRDNNFEFELMSYEFSEIIKRHSIFLNTYFDIILEKLKTILTDFVKGLENLEKMIAKNNFETIVKVTSLYFESIFKSDYVYDKESLLKIFNKRQENLRYQNLIDLFYKDLKANINGTKLYVKELFEEQKEIEPKHIEKPIINITFSKPDKRKIKNEKLSYHYELGKLATKRNSTDFEFFGSCLKSMCKENELVINELEHMELNIDNEIEYYSSLRLINTILKE